MGVGRVAVRNHDAFGRFAQQAVDHVARPRGQQVEHHHPGRDDTPDPLARGALARSGGE